MSRKLDVRWPDELLTKAEGIALGAGVRTSEVLRRAAICGMDEAARVLARERAPAAARPSKMPSAGADGSPTVAAGVGASPRPSTPASARVRLDVVVAQMMEGGLGGGSRGPAPISLARARRKIKDGRVCVDGEVATDEAATVDPRAVTFANQ